MKLLYFIPIFFVALFVVPEKTIAHTGASDHVPDYQLNLEIDPATKAINVSGSLTIQLKDSQQAPACFYLHRDFKINQLTCNGTSIIQTDSSESDNRFLPLAKRVSLSYAQIEAEQTLVFQFAYEGTPEDLPAIFGNCITKNYTEIGLYYPWFPFNPDQIRLFTYRVAVNAPDSYQTFGLGNVKKNGNKTILQSAVPTNDIVVCLSEQVEQYNVPLNGGQLAIYHNKLDELLLQAMSNDIQYSLNRFNNWLTAKPMTISIIESQRNSGGGYARIGGIVLGGISKEKYNEEPEYYLRYFAHELAHLWWYKAPTNSWEDWLNESFAEYFALLVIREINGQAAFNQWLLEKRQQAADAPPIWQFDRNNAPYKEAKKVLYDAGPLRLYQLEQKIGQNEFLSLCQLLVKKEVTTTASLLNHLKTSYGAETANWFENLLRNS